MSDAANVVEFIFTVPAAQAERFVAALSASISLPPSLEAAREAAVQWATSTVANVERSQAEQVARESIVLPEPIEVT